MKKMAVGLSALVLLATGVVASGGASAAPAFATSDAGVATGGGVVNVDYFYEGRRYCWYPEGWHGPGWYWCGYAWRRGYGWGSPVWGWNGWAWGGPRYRGGFRGGYRGDFRGGRGGPHHHH